MVKVFEVKYSGEIESLYAQNKSWARDYQKFCKIKFPLKDFFSQNIFDKPFE